MKHQRMLWFSLSFLFFVYVAIGPSCTSSGPTEVTSERVNEKVGEAAVEPGVEKVTQGEFAPGKESDADFADGGGTEPPADRGTPTPPEPSSEGNAASCSANPPARVVDVSVQDLYKLIQDNAKLAIVDVREPSETATGVIAGALLYPWIGGKLKADHAKLPSDRPLYIICASGNRSRRAADFLFQNGHKCVHNVLGGMIAWKKAGYPTSKP